MLCYCNSQKPFIDCCQTLISGKNKALTAEQLMRSRYSAYVLADINYLLNTHHSSSRPTKERKEILKWTKAVQWVGLNIISKKKGDLLDTEGWVEFKATFIQNSKIECIHENSYFKKEDGVWYYKSGVHS